MSWEGHQEMGRGAIFANYDDARKEDKLNEVSYGSQTLRRFVHCGPLGVCRCRMPG